MSLYLYSVRLFWNGITGCARYHDRLVTLHQKPDVAITDFDEIDYAPEAGTFQMKPKFFGFRDMDQKEIQACIRYLVGL
jgi:hypothetical protein